MFYILKNESLSSIDQSNEDIHCIMSEFKLEDLDLLEQQCYVAVDNIFVPDEMVAHESFKTLMAILADIRLSLKMKNNFLTLAFTRFYNFFKYMDHLVSGFELLGVMLNEYEYCSRPNRSYLSVKSGSV